MKATHAGPMCSTMRKIALNALAQTHPPGVPLSSERQRYQVAIEV